MSNAVLFFVFLNLFAIGATIVNIKIKLSMKTMVKADWLMDTIVLLASSTLIILVVFF